MLSAKFKGQRRRSRHSWTKKQQRQQIKNTCCHVTHLTKTVSAVTFKVQKPDL